VPHSLLANVASVGRRKTFLEFVPRDNAIHSHSLAAFLLRLRSRTANDQLAGRLAELHAQHGTQKCVPVPSVLADGRLMLCADVLTEIEPGGLLHAMWEAADKNVLNAAVEVLPWAEAVALLPPDPPMGE